MMWQFVSLDRLEISWSGSVTFIAYFGPPLKTSMNNLIPCHFQVNEFLAYMAVGHSMTHQWLLSFRFSMQLWPSCE